MDLKYSQMRQLTNYSNDKMVNIIKTKIAESENAAVALVFDDQLIILDEDTDEFHVAKYKIDNRALKLTNWEKVNLTPDSDTKLESIANKYFNPLNEEEITVKNMLDAFNLKFSDEPIKELINNTHVEKCGIVSSTPKIKALREVRKIRGEFSDDITELFEDDKIKSLLVTISEDGPVQNTISKIDFKRPVSVALFESSSNKVVNLSKEKVNKQRTKNIRSKVNNLWTSQSFKNDFSDLIKDMSESEDVKETLSKFVNQHKEILLISESELEDLIVKTTLMIGEAQNTEELSDIFKEYINIDEVQQMKNEYIKRNKINEENEKEDEEEEMPPEGEEEPEEKDEKEKESTIDEDSINKILKVLNKIKEPLEDKTLESKFVNAFIQNLEDAKVGSIGEGKLKEVLDFLSAIYEDAQSKKEEE